MLWQAESNDALAYFYSVTKAAAHKCCLHTCGYIIDCVHQPRYFTSKFTQQYNKRPKQVILDSSMHCLGFTLLDICACFIIDCRSFIHSPKSQRNFSNKSGIDLSSSHLISSQTHLLAAHPINKRQIISLFIYNCLLFFMHILNKNCTPCTLQQRKNSLLKHISGVIPTLLCFIRKEISKFISILLFISVIHNLLEV